MKVGSIAHNHTVLKLKRFKSCFFGAIGLLDLPGWRDYNTRNGYSKIRVYTYMLINFIPVKHEFKNGVTYINLIIQAIRD
jgi:hypothetical protein